MVSIRNDKTGEGEIDRSQSSIDSYWKISVKHFFVTCHPAVNFFKVEIFRVKSHLFSKVLITIAMGPIAFETRAPLS
jgi:hypothetical protein